MNKISIKLLFTVFFLFLAQFTFAETVEFQFLSKDAEVFLGSMQNGNDFSGIFTTLFKYIIYLAAVIAIIELIYYGAKYAIVDSFTGKKMAKENFVPITMGLAALLGTYVLFNTINPEILSGKFATNEQEVQNVLQNMRNASQNNNPLNVQDAAYQQEQRINKASEELQIDLQEIKTEYESIRQKTSAKKIKEEFDKICTQQGDNIGICAKNYSYTIQCVRNGVMCDKLQGENIKYIIIMKEALNNINERLNTQNNSTSTQN